MTTNTNRHSLGPQLLATKYKPQEVLASDVTISTYTAPRDSIIKHFIPHVDYTLDDSWLYSLGPLGLEDDDEVDDGVQDDRGKNKLDFDTSTNYLSHIYGTVGQDMGGVDDGNERVDSQGGVGKMNHSKYGMVYQEKEVDRNNNSIDQGDGKHQVGRDSIVCDDRAQGSLKKNGHMEQNGKSGHPDNGYQKHFLNASSTEDEDSVYANNETRNAEDILKSRKKQNTVVKSCKETPATRNTAHSPIIRREKIRYVSDALETSSKRCTSYMNGSIEPDGNRASLVQEKTEKSKPIKTKKEESYFEKLRSKKIESKKKGSSSKEKHLKDAKVERAGHSSGLKLVNSKGKKSRSSSGKSIELIKDISLGNGDEVFNGVNESSDKSSEDHTSRNVQSDNENDKPNIIAFDTHIKQKDDTAGTSSGKIAKTVKTVFKTIPFGPTKNEGALKWSNKEAEIQRLKSKLLTPLTAPSMVMEKIHKNISHDKSQTCKSFDLPMTRNNTLPSVSRTNSQTCSRTHTSRQTNGCKTTRDSSNLNIQSKGVYTKTRSQDNVELRVLFPRDNPTSRDKSRSRGEETTCLRRHNSFGPSCTRRRNQSIENVPSSQEDTTKNHNTSKPDHQDSKATPRGSRRTQISRHRSKSFTLGRNKTNSDLFFHERIVPPSATRPKSMCSFGNKATLMETLNKRETSKSCDNMKLKWKSSDKWTVNNSSQVAHERIIPRSKSHGNIKSRSTSCEGVKMRCIFFKEDIHDAASGKVKRSRSFGAATAKQNLYVQNERIVKTSMKSEPNLGAVEKSFTVVERLGMQENLLGHLQRDCMEAEKMVGHCVKKDSTGVIAGVDHNSTLSDTTTSKHFWKNLERGLLSLQQDLASKDVPSQFDKIVESELNRNIADPSNMSFRNGEKLSMICEMFKNEDLGSLNLRENEQLGDTLLVAPPPPPQGVNRISCSTISNTTTLEHEPQHLQDILSVGDFERGFHLDDVLSQSQQGCSTELLGREKLKYIRIKERARELRAANMNAREILNVLLLETIRDKQSNTNVYQLPGAVNQNAGVRHDHVNGTGKSSNGHGEQKKEKEEKSSADADIGKEVTATGCDQSHPSPTKPCKSVKTEETLKKELKIIEDLFQNIDSKKLLKELNLNDDVLKTMMRTVKREKLKKSKSKDYQKVDLGEDSGENAGQLSNLRTDGTYMKTNHSNKDQGSTEVEEKIQGVNISDIPVSFSLNYSSYDPSRKDAFDGRHAHDGIKENKDQEERNDEIKESNQEEQENEFGQNVDYDNEEQRQQLRRLEDKNKGEEDDADEDEEREKENNEDRNDEGRKNNEEGEEKEDEGQDGEDKDLVEIEKETSEIKIIEKQLQQENEGESLLLPVEKAIEVEKGIEIEKRIEVDRGIEIEKIVEVEKIIEVEKRLEIEKRIEEEISPHTIIDQEDLNELDKLFTSLDNITHKGAAPKKKKNRGREESPAVEEEIFRRVDVEDVQQMADFDSAFALLNDTSYDGSSCSSSRNSRSSSSSSNVIDPQQRTHSFINLSTIPTINDDTEVSRDVYSTVHLHELQCEKLAVKEQLWLVNDDDVENREDNSETDSVFDDDLSCDNPKWSYSNLSSSKKVSAERNHEELTKPLKNITEDEGNMDHLSEEFNESALFADHPIDSRFNLNKDENEKENKDNDNDHNYDSNDGDDNDKDVHRKVDTDFNINSFDEEWNIDDLVSYRSPLPDIQPEETYTKEISTELSKAPDHWSGCEEEKKVCVKTSVLIQSDTTTTSLDDQNILGDDETFQQIVERLCESVRRELPQHVDNEQLEEGVELNTTVLIMAGDNGDDEIIEKESLICNEEQLSHLMRELSQQVSANRLLSVIKPNELFSNYDIGINIDLALPKSALIHEENSEATIQENLRENGCDNEHMNTLQLKDRTSSNNNIDPLSSQSQEVDNNCEPVKLPVQMHDVEEDLEVLTETIAVTDTCETCSASDNEVTFDILIPTETDDNTDLTIEIIIDDGKEDLNENKAYTNRNDTELIQEEFHCERRCHCGASTTPSGRLNPLNDDTDRSLLQQKEAVQRDKSTPTFMKQLYESVDIDKMLNYRSFFDPDILHSSSYLDSNLIKDSLLVTDKDSLLEAGGGSSCLASPDVSVFSADDIDSGTDLQYDDLFSPTDSHDNDNDNDAWLINVKPLLIDSEVVANLFVRLSNKYNEYKTLGNKAYSMQQIHMATTAYEVITHNNLTNFAHVLSHLLSFLGLIKCEKEPPGNVSTPNVLIFLQELVENASLSTFHITVLTVLLARTNDRLKRYHSLRVNLLHACFVQEMRRLKITAGELHHITICFMKISEYFVHLDRDLTCTLIDDYILPNLTKNNSVGFIENVLQYMGLSSSEKTAGGNVITTADISSSLVLLTFILKRRSLPDEATQLLSQTVNSDHPKFRFCEDERKMLLEILKDLKHT